MKAGALRLKPEDWNSDLWLIDVCAPFGGVAEIIRQLRESVFKSKKIKSLQPAPDGVGAAVVEW